MTIKLKVKNSLLFDYVHYLFSSNKEGFLKVSSTSTFGKLLIAHCRETFSPIPDPQGDLVVAFELPLVAASQSLNNKFIYYSAADTAALNLALTAVFDLDFNGYYRIGEKLNMQKKNIVEAFIFSRKLISTECFDALHKRIYRREQKYMKAITQKLVRRAYYLDETINTNGLRYDTNY